MEKAGFFTLQPKYFRNITDAGFEDTRVTQAGKSVEASNYASAGLGSALLPLERNGALHRVHAEVCANSN